MTSSPEARVAAHCRRHRLLPPGAPVLAMVSGGADSTCLMHLLAELHDGPLEVLSIDHGLRPEAAAECAAVVEAAGRLGLGAHVVALGLEPGPGLQERARAARMAAALAHADAGGFVRIATGHTASDQAETVLMRLARGTGRDGARGIAPRRGPFVRPLLALTAAQTRAWCAGRGLEVVRDPSNADPRFTRARVRGGLLAALAEVHPDAERHVAAFAERLADEAALLAPLVDAAWERVARVGGLDAAALAAEPAPMRRLLVRRLLAEAGAPGDALAAAAVERVLALADGASATGLPGAVRVVRERGVIRVAAPAAPAPAEAPLGVPGRAAFGARTLRAWAGAGAPPRPDRVAVACAGPLTVRAPRPGDRLVLRGGGHAAVGRLLAAAGVPARLRDRVPVVATPERVVWVAGHRAADDLLVTDGGPAVVLCLDQEPA